MDLAHHQAAEVVQVAPQDLGVGCGRASGAGNGTFTLGRLRADRRRTGACCAVSLVARGKPTGLPTAGCRQTPRR